MEVTVPKTQLENDTLVELLDNCMQKRLEAKELKDKAEELESEANEILKIAMPENNLDTYQDELGNKLLYSAVDYSTMKPTLLKEILIREGIPADTVMKWWNQATETKPRPMVKLIKTKDYNTD
jgi:uncharacterized protein Yka (UPF0111/DUF47 family)